MHPQLQLYVAAPDRVPAFALSLPVPTGQSIRRPLLAQATQPHACTTRPRARKQRPPPAGAARVAHELADRLAAHGLLDPSHREQSRLQPPRTLLGIAGVPGAGKTTVARLLVQRLQEMSMANNNQQSLQKLVPETMARRTRRRRRRRSQFRNSDEQLLNQRHRADDAVAKGRLGGPSSGSFSPALVSMDGWHYPRSALDAFPDPVEAHRRRGAPFTFDVDAFAQALQDMRRVTFEPQSSGQGTKLENCVYVPVPVPTFDHAVKDPVPAGAVVPPEASLVVVEGNCLCLKDHPDWRDDILTAFDVIVFLDVDIDAAMQRVVARHRKQLGLTEQEARNRMKENDRPNALLIESSASHASIRIQCE